MTASLFATRLAIAGCFIVFSLLGASDSLAQQWDGGQFEAPRTAATTRTPGVYGQLEAIRTTARVDASIANVAESEPNNFLVESDSVLLGDVIDGVIGSDGDFDYFGLDLVAGDVLDVDVDAFAVGSALDAVVALFRIDTVPADTQPIDTVIVWINDNADLLDSRIVWSVEKTGRYFVGITDFDREGSPSHTYSLKLLSQTVDETGPNNDPGTAQLITLGDTVFGFINPAADVDYYAIDLPAGSVFDVDSDAQEVGSGLFAALRIFASDGTTLLNFSAGAQDVKVRFFTPTGGRFYVQISDRDGFGGPPFFYTLKVDTIPKGPGDPTTLYASGIGRPGGIIAGPGGELFVVDLGSARLLRVPPGGGPVVELAQLGRMVDVTLDGFGDLLVTGIQNQATIWRVTLDGTVSKFTDHIRFPGAITVGPDGDVWVSDPQFPEMIWRFSSQGELVDSILTPNIGLPVLDMAFSPSGVLHFTNRGDRVLKIVDGAVELAFLVLPTTEGIAFDRDGYLYLANGFERRVALYEPDYTLLDPNFSVTNLGGPIMLSFGRQADGEMTPRLFAANSSFGILPPFAGGIVEFNPAGMRAAGFRVGVDLLVISTTPLDTGTIGAEYSDTLTVAEFTGDVTWSIESGELPEGLTLVPGTGEIGGVPEVAGTFALTIRAESGSRFGTEQHTIEVVAPAVAVTDFVDELLGLGGLLGDPLKNFLDITGNRNGILDIGDLRVFLRIRSPDPAGGAVPSAYEGNRSER